MAINRFNTATEFAFYETTESVNILPETGVTFNVSYWTGEAWSADGNNPYSAPVNALIQATKIKIEPIGGYVAVASKGQL